MSGERPTLAEALRDVWLVRGGTVAPVREHCEAFADAAEEWFLDRLAAHPPKCNDADDACVCGPLYCGACSEDALEWVRWTPAHVLDPDPEAVRGDE